MTSSSQPIPLHPAPQRAGRALIGAAVGAVAPFMLSLLVGLVFGGRVYASPFASDDTLHGYFAGHHTLVQVVAFLQFGSAIGLGVLSCLLWSRLRELAPDAAAARHAVAVGGGVAASFLALNALIQWVLSHSEVNAQPALVKALSYLFWTLGGAAHTAWLGLLVGGASLVALRLRLLPHWLAIAGLVVTGLAELSLLTLLTTRVVAFIPLGRFPALLWLVVASVLLSRRTSRRPRSAGLLAA
jgi:hypothetical protein